MIDEYSSRTPDGAITMHLLMGVLVLAVAVLFALGTGLASVPLLGLIAVTAYGWIRYEGETAKALTLLATALTVSILALIVGYLIWHSLPAIEKVGLELFTGGTSWDAEASGDTGSFSLTPMLMGTALTTLIATAIAAPLGIAGAVFLSELAPPRVRAVVKPGVELLAGIPSITYGFVGLTLVNQYFFMQFQTPAIASYFAAGLMIGLMALPTVVTVAEDALSSVPESMKGGSLAVGSTEWQTTKSVTLPAALSGVSAAVLLGVGRAMGETMAATVMLSHTKGFPSPFFDVFSRWGETLTTVIAFEAPNAGGLHESVLFAAGAVLFFTVMSLSIAAQWIEWRMHRKLGGDA
ncbi:phosphate ABC transporter permease subunit PstC [Salinarchaeum chitinilyticum]